MKLFKNFEIDNENNTIIYMSELKRIDYFIGTSKFSLFIDTLRTTRSNKNTIILECFYKNMLVFRTELLKADFHTFNETIHLLQIETLSKNKIKYYLY